MKKIIFNGIKIFIFIASILCVPENFAQAAVQQDQTVWDNMFYYIKPIGGAFGYRSGVPTDIRVIVINVLQALSYLLVTIFICLILYGGYTWMMARGEEEEVKRAKGIIKMGVIGVFIIFSSVAITRFVITTAVCATSEYNDWCIYFSRL